MQNTSSAVMQQRHEALDSLDDFPTPPWATRALVEHVLKALPAGLNSRAVYEPACNRGFMARPLAEYASTVHASDIFSYGWSGQERQVDFLFDEAPADVAEAWLVSNPPFALAERFIAAGLDRGFAGIAMFVRTSFLEGVGRYEGIYSKRPPTIVAQFAERVILSKGVVRDPAVLYWDPDADDGVGKWKKPSTATSYCWLVWARGEAPGPMVWIPPCRKKLERPGDYEVKP
ncbi:MAG: methyltransferase [Devosia sp.]|nr:methyltransferase [Devosia sp.]